MTTRSFCHFLYQRVNVFVAAIFEISNKANLVTSTLEV